MTQHSDEVKCKLPIQHLIRITHTNQIIELKIFDLLALQPLQLHTKARTYSIDTHTQTYEQEEKNV